MSEKLIDFGKQTTQYFLTLIFAAVGTYVGVRVSMAEMKSDIQYLQRDAERKEVQISAYKTALDEMKPNVDILSWMHNIGMRDIIKNDHEHTEN